jgi:hypothetical protein
MDNIILVLYLGVEGLTPSEVEVHATSIGKTLFPEETMKKLNAVSFIIPVLSKDTRLECINPTLITDEEVKRQHRLKLDELNEHLTHFIEQYQKPNE